MVYKGKNYKLLGLQPKKACTWTLQAHQVWEGPKDQEITKNEQLVTTGKVQGAQYQ